MVSLGVREACGVLCPLHGRGVRGGVGAGNAGGAGGGCPCAGVEGLREEVTRLAEVLEAAEMELDRRVIAREELVEALAVSAAESTAVTGTWAEEEVAPSRTVTGPTLCPRRRSSPWTRRQRSYPCVLEGMSPALYLRVGTDTAHLPAIGLHIDYKVIQ